MPFRTHRFQALNLDAFTLKTLNVFYFLLKKIVSFHPLVKSDWFMSVQDAETVEVYSEIETVFCCTLFVFCTELSSEQSTHRWPTKLSEFKEGIMPGKVPSLHRFWIRSGNCF